MRSLPSDGMFILTVDENTTLAMVEPRDAEAIFALVEASRMYLREWLPCVDGTSSVEDTRGFIDRARQQYADDNGFQCGVRDNREVVGIIGFHRVEIRVAVENQKSRAIPERLGFTHEGTLRESEWLNGHYVDGAVYSLLRQEWER